MGVGVGLAKIGFIGMGLMGIPMSCRLLAAGYAVTVWNRNPDKTQLPVKQGAQVANSLTELCKNSDIIMLCVSDTSAVEEIVLAKGGVLENLVAGKIIIDFSSIDPETTRRLAKLVAGKSCHWLDTPVSGGVSGAEQGTLAIMAGGEEKLLDSVRPLLEPLSQRITRMGDVGAGQVTKICNQMIVSCNVLVMAEVMALAEKSGVDSTLIPLALKGGFADSIPLQLTGPRMAERDYEPVKWHVKTLLKDLDMANNLARNNGSSIPVAGLGAELMRLHASKGFNESDPSTFIEMYSADLQKHKESKQ
ncbi:6-phosphogluconate dehydrogenase [Oleispira antarctica RB-8]|uniref:6-phosphogluconate dehydrogenase n=1 Tax=Oleispira antarctica RB-8 TaxID=698738 RepID=R4YQK0_OLEAN|nr:6-phosphogluconate dehydrogenase [Oleispira antarctica RB-8]